MNRLEIIECPECKTVQEARPEHTALFVDYSHDCTGCGYMIMESEWSALTDEELLEDIERSLFQAVNMKPLGDVYAYAFSKLKKESGKVLAPV